MQLSLKSVCGFLIFIVSCAACSISNDADRCSGIYKWDPAVNGCSLIEADDSAVETDTQPTGDAGETEESDPADTDLTPQGVGDSCTSTEICAAMDERLFCGGNPTDGYCTFDCTSIACPSDFVCCTGTMEGIETFCMKETEYEEMGVLVCGSK